jgi:glyoxalase/bleomycin resistance protein/dioxygenase superfamily protein
MSGPRIDQINLVVGDVQEVTDFLSQLGVDIPAGPPGWEVWASHHGTLPTAQPFDLDIDSSAFAREWGGLPASFTGAVVTLRVDERAEVDRVHELATSLGAPSRKAPYDAFWGSRYALVEGPASVVVGIMSPRDDDHRSDPPDPAAFA